MANPVKRGRHGAPPAECRNAVGRAGELSIGFAAPKKAGHSLSRDHNNVLGPKTHEFVDAETPPESQKKHRPVPPASKRVRSIPARVGGRDGGFKPVSHLGNGGELQGFGALLVSWVECLDAFQRLFHDGGGRIGKPVYLMPMGECCQSLSKRVDGQGRRVGHQIIRYALGGRRKQTTPGHLKMTHGRGVATLSIFTLRRLQIGFKRMRWHCRIHSFVRAKYNAIRQWFCA